MMEEIVLRLGPEQNLVGVVTPALGPSRPLAVLMLNAGVIHRIGPARMSVKTARHLAQRGYTAVRFDLSGRGDSRAPRNAVPHREQAVDDTKSVMDHLEREHGLSAFALWGICSGAENAYATALRDDRVAGLFMFDGYGYPTLKARAIDYASRLRALSFAKIEGRLRRMLHGATARANPGDAEREAEAPLSPPPRARFAADMDRLVDRGVRVAMVFSTNSDYWYPTQMRDAFRRYGFMRGVVCHHAPDINHLVTLLAAQQRVLALIDEWIASIAA